MFNTGIFRYCEKSTSIRWQSFFQISEKSTGPLIFYEFFFNGMSKRQVDVMHNRASSGDQVAIVTSYKYLFTKCSRIGAGSGILEKIRMLLCARIFGEYPRLAYGENY